MLGFTDSTIDRIARLDTLVFCCCYRNGCLEIKCPFDSKEKFIFEILEWMVVIVKMFNVKGRKYF